MHRDVSSNCVCKGHIIYSVSNHLHVYLYLPVYTYLYTYTYNYIIYMSVPMPTSISISCHSPCTNAGSNLYRTHTGPLQVYDNPYSW